MAESVEAWVSTWNGAGHRHVARFQRVDPPVAVGRCAPQAIHPSGDWRWDRWRRSIDASCPDLPTPGTFVAEIPDGRVVGADGAVITPDDALLAEVSIDLGVIMGGNPRSHAVFDEVVRPPVGRVEGLVANLTVLGGENYFHWMFHVTPRLDLLRRAGLDLSAVDRFVINRISQPFQIQTLDALGIPRNKLIEAHARTHIRAETLVVPSRPARMSEMTSTCCKVVRDLFLDAECKQDRPDGDLIYLRRGNVRHRWVENDDAVMAILQPLGFREVLLETMSVGDQARTLARAGTVVAPHGAGLTNVVFARPGTRVVELFAPTYVNGCYWLLSCIRGCDYYFVIGEGPAPSGHVFDLVANMTVDLDGLRDTLEIAGVV